MLAQWGGGWRVSAVATATCKTNHVPDGHARLSPRNEERLDQLIRANRRITTRQLCTELNIASVLLQHENARTHTSLKTVEHTVKLGWTIVPHRPYSPDLAPSDFHLFGPIKDGLCGQHFPSYVTVIWVVKQWATSAGADFYERGMQALVHRWRKCIAKSGDYVEK